VSSFNTSLFRRDGKKHNAKQNDEGTTERSLCYLAESTMPDVSVLQYQLRPPTSIVQYAGGPRSTMLWLETIQLSSYQLPPTTYHAPRKYCT